MGHHRIMVDITQAMFFHNASFLARIYWFNNILSVRQHPKASPILQQVMIVLTRIFNTLVGVSSILVF